MKEAKKDKSPDALDENRSESVLESVLLEEYKSIRSEIEQRLSWQHQVVVVGATTLVALAGAAFAFGSPSEKPVATLLVLLSVAYLSTVLVMLLVNIDRVIQDLASYQDRVLKPQLETLSGAPVLLWHEYYHRVSYSHDVPLRERLPRILTGPFPHAFFLLPGWLAAILAALLLFSSAVRHPSVCTCPYLCLGASDLSTQPSRLW